MFETILRNIWDISSYCFKWFPFLTWESEYMISTGLALTVSITWAIKKTDN